AGLVWSLITGSTQVRIFFLTCVLIAGVYGAVSVSKKILFPPGPARRCRLDRHAGPPLILAGERVPTSSPRRASGSLHLGTVGIEGVLRLNTRSDLRLSGHHSDAHMDRSDGGDSPRSGEHLM